MGLPKGSAFVEHDSELCWLPTINKDFILPAGFPDSVSDDYLDYIMLQFPTNVTGWICHTLVTSSLLKAIGIGSFSGSTAAAAAATIRWVSKDGIGAVGRLFIGGDIYCHH
ncbi:protein root UVB sensitive 5-like isoform X4 [Primulina huaijiensis]|uniref:protein root UVB sensitive 5-like isoform X4 n=1 Tax=Primulina huaijiensis TaxID=1492673 RepID=UPI003CC6E368